MKFAVEDYTWHCTYFSLFFFFGKLKPKLTAKFAWIDTFNNVIFTVEEKVKDVAIKYNKVGQFSTGSFPTKHSYIFTGPVKPTAKRKYGRSDHSHPWHLTTYPWRLTTHPWRLTTHPWRPTTHPWRLVTHPWLQCRSGPQPILAPNTCHWQHCTDIQLCTSTSALQPGVSC